MSEQKIPECIRQSEQMAEYLLKEVIPSSLGYCIEIKVEESLHEHYPAFIVLLYSKKIPVLPYFEFVFFHKENLFTYSRGTNSKIFELRRKYTNSCFEVTDVGFKDAIGYDVLLEKVKKYTLETLFEREWSKRKEKKGSGWAQDKN